MIKSIERIVDGSKKRMDKRLSECRTSRGETPLMSACRYGHVSAVKLLLEASYGGGGSGEERLVVRNTVRVGGSGSKYEEENRDGNDDDEFRYLLNTADVHGETAIIAATLRNEIEMVELLLQYNANDAHVTDTNDTLHSFVRMFERIEIGNLCVEYGKPDPKIALDKLKKLEMLNEGGWFA